ncbi:hypothetical protein [Pseudomonas sp. RIT-PI-S]|uniref:hypothetical protein n=1 Tax=Pseudomonas sp. RIT-PI-S TaxID=3035295 RepID=UPI0021D8E779|nr:hypothetical protein [Pseudomonas sp. RIT-PI-S]
MSLGKTEQALIRDLEDVAKDLHWSATELKHIAQRLEKSGNVIDADALKRMIGAFENGEPRLKRYAEEVRAGRIAGAGVHQVEPGASLPS